MAVVTEPNLRDEDGQEATVPAENATHVVWRLAWPAVALNSLQVINTLLDRGFIGHLPGAALTAHGGSTTVMFLMFSLAIALATGATALTSRAYGAGQPEEFRMASRQSFRLAMFGGILMAVLTGFSAKAVASWTLPSDNPEAIHLMAQFVLAYALGLPAIFVIQTIAGCMRGVGDTKSPMVISGVQILLHILLNFTLIMPTRKILGITIPGVGMGLVGAATALSASATMAAIGYVMYVRHTPLGAVWSFNPPDLQWAKRILRIAMPAALMSSLRVFSMMSLILILALVPGGSVAIGAMTLAFSIESIMFMPAFGLSVAAGALVGQSLGMRRPDRAERLGWTAANHAAIVTALLVGPIAWEALAIVGVLVEGQPAIQAEAALLLRYLCATEVLFCYAMVLIGAMQGAGDTKRPMWIVIIALWGLRVPLAFVLALHVGQAFFHGLATPVGFDMGARGVWLALAFTQAIQGVMAVALFRQGGWKLKKV